MPIPINDIAISQPSQIDRVLLAQKLWDSIGTKTLNELCPLSPEDVAEVERRCAAIDAGEMQCIPLDDAMRQIRLPK